MKGVDEEFSQTLRLYIETSVVHISGYDLLVGPQPMILSPLDYQHVETVQCIRSRTGGCGSIMTMHMYQITLDNEKEWESESLRLYINKEINYFVSTIVVDHFKRPLLNRFVVNTVSFGSSHIIIEYLVGVADQIELDPAQIIAVHTSTGKVPNEWIVRYQLVSSRA